MADLTAQQGGRESLVMRANVAILLPRRRSCFSLDDETPPQQGFHGKRMMGFEPTTFCMASRRSSQLSYIRAGRIIAGAQGADLATPPGGRAGSARAAV
jgi:hypothetical protein